MFIIHIDQCYPIERYNVNYIGNFFINKNRGIKGSSKTNFGLINFWFEIQIIF